MPVDEFYLNLKSGKPQNYCKCCRKEASRKQRKSDKETDRRKRRRRGRLIITEVQDRELRLSLIMMALTKVRESIERKNKRLKDADFRRDK